MGSVCLRLIRFHAVSGERTLLHSSFLLALLERSPAFRASTDFSCPVVEDGLLHHIYNCCQLEWEAAGKPYNNTMQWNESMLKSPAKPHAGNIWLFEVILSTTMAKRKMASHRSPVDCRKLCTLCVCLCERARCWGIYSLSFALFVLRNVGSERGSGAREDKKKHLL